jgi:cytochrome P450
LRLREEELLADPYPLYHELRRRDPVHWSEEWQAWLLSRYADVADCMADGRLRVSRVEDFSQRLAGDTGTLAPEIRRIEQVLAGWLLFTDPPRHRRLRGLISRSFTPATIHRLEGSVQERVDELLAGLAGEADLMEVLARPLPALTVADMLGADLADRDQFMHWSRPLVAFLGTDTLNAEQVCLTASTLQAMEDYFREILERRRRRPQDDLISGMLAAREKDDRLTEEEILHMCTLLFAAGHDTTTNLIGNSLLALMEHPEARQALTRDPGKLEGAIEEFLRWDSPSQIASRWASQDLQVGGRLIRQGQVVNFLIGAANRDPQQFPDPDRLDIERTDNRHLSFGRGIHACVGAFLARLEARLAVGTVLRRWPGLRLAGTPERQPTIGFRGLKSLPVALEAR